MLPPASAAGEVLAKRSACRMQDSSMRCVRSEWHLPLKRTWHPALSFSCRSIDQAHPPTAGATQRGTSGNIESPNGHWVVGDGALLVHCWRLPDEWESLCVYDTLRRSNHAPLAVSNPQTVSRKGSPPAFGSVALLSSTVAPVSVAA